MSRCVGGGSVHYGAVCFRFRPEDFHARSTWGDLPGADIVDWPLDVRRSRARRTARSRSCIGVAGGRMKDEQQPAAPVPGAEWRTDPYPMPGHPPNYGAKLFEDAARALGFHPFPTPVAINNGSVRRADPGCSYCGFCSSHGCPIDAKGDTRVTALAKAVRHRALRDPAGLVRVPDRVVRTATRSACLYVDGDGATRAAEAERFVLACSTVDTPRLVLLSELPRDLVNHDVVGRYLKVHHFPAAIGFFEQRIDYYRGFWSMRCLDDFYLGPPGRPRCFGFGNIQTVGPSSGYPLLAGGIISTAKSAVGRGAQAVDAAASSATSSSSG